MLHFTTKRLTSLHAAVAAGVCAPLLVGGLLLVRAEPPPVPVPGIHFGTPPVGAPWKMHTIDGAIRGPDGVKLADANHDGLPDIATGWERAGVTRLYLHPGSAGVRGPWPGVTVGSTIKAEDAVLVDLDGDGALDIVTSTEGDERRVYVHWSPKSPADLLDPGAWKQEHFPAVQGLTQWMFAQPVDIDGRNGIDLVIAGKNDDRSIPSTIGWLEAPPNPRNTGAWRWHPLREDVSWIMSIIAEDINGDGHLDILFTDKHGASPGIHWLRNPGRGELVDKLWEKHSIPVPGLSETSFAAVADLDGDGLRDIVASATLPAGKGAEAVVGVPDGAGPAESNNLVFLRRLDGSGDHWKLHVISAPAGTGLPKGVSVGDIDLDGRPDLVVTCSGAVDNLIGVYWLSWRKGLAEPVWDAHDISGPVGIKYDLVPLVDLDGDGDLDAISTEEKEGDKKGLGVVWYENPTRPSVPVLAVATDPAGAAPAN